MWSALPSLIWVPGASSTPSLRLPLLKCDGVSPQERDARATAYGCRVSYAIYVGANLSRDGCAYLAGYGDEPSSHWLEIAPRAEHPAGTEIEVGVTEASAMPGVRTTIPQAPVTARHLRVNYSYYRGVPGPLTNGGLNEHGVAVRDVWSASSERLRAMTPPDQRGLNYSDLARVVLERARTAREGVELVGSLIDSYGEATYGGNSHLIADADEGWVVIEFAGGQGLWVAARLDADTIRVSRPGVIEEVPPDYLTHPDFAGAPHLIAFAVEQGWYDPTSGPFNANAVYGDGLGRWQGVRWIEGELAARAARPQRLGLSDLIWAVRTERLTGDTAGYGQVVPLPAEQHPDLRVLWHAPVGAIAAPLTPFFLGVDSIPPEYRRHRYLTAGEESAFVGARGGDSPSSVSQRVEATRSAVVTFKRLLYLLAEHHELFLPEVTPVWEAFEAESAAELGSVVEAADVLIRAQRFDLARELLTRFSHGQALRALDLGEAMVDSMDARSRLLFGIRDDGGWRGPEQLW
jgi:dipeptidase